MGKKERRFKRSQDAQRLARNKKMSVDPNISLEDFLSMTGILPQALIMDTWGNAIEDPDVLDRCRETLMRHILDRPVLTFATLGHTPEFKNLIQRLNGVLEVINQSMMLAQPEDTIDTNRMLQLESRPFTMEDVNITFNPSSIDYPGDTPGIDNEEGGYRAKDIYIDLIWAAPVVDTREDFVEGFGRFIQMVSHPIRPEPWLARIIDSTETMDTIVNRRSEMLKDLGIKNRIPSDFSSALREGMRNRNNGVTVQAIAWNDKYSCMVGEAAVQWRFSADDWKGLGWNPPVPGSRWDLGQNRQAGNLRELARKGQLPAVDVKDEKYTKHSTLHHWGIPGMKDFYKCEAAETLRSAMADLLNGDEESTKRLIQPIIDGWFLLRPGLVFTPDGSELDDAGMGYNSLIERMFPLHHKSPMMVMDASRKDYAIPRLEWWGLTEVYRGNAKEDRSNQFSYRKPIANSLELEEGVLKIIKNLCPYYDSYTETVVRSAWLKQDRIPKLVGRLDNDLTHLIPTESSQEKQKWDMSVMKPINSWRYSWGDYRDESQSIGKILFNLSTRSVVGVELYETERGTDPADY